MRLTRGVLLVDYANNIVNDGALSLSDGFCLGNGNEEDDIDVHVLSGGSLTVASGVFDYRNVN